MEIEVNRSAPSFLSPRSTGQGIDLNSVKPLVACLRAQKFDRWSVRDESHQFAFRRWQAFPGVLDWAGSDIGDGTSDHPSLHRLSAFETATRLLRQGLLHVKNKANETSMGPKARDRRPRRSHNLGGCGTCRRRHVKCDQVQPHCLACRAVRQPCDGYASTVR